MASFIDYFQLIALVTELSFSCMTVISGDATDDYQCNQLLACNFKNNTNCETHPNRTDCERLTNPCPCQKVECFRYQQLCGYFCENSNQTDIEGCLTCLSDGDNKNCTFSCRGICLNQTCGNFSKPCYNPQDCPLGYFGEKCSQLCSNVCKGSCDRVTGFCQICRGNFYGQNCEINCSKNCLNNVCLETNGTCIDCALGYHGNSCNEQCPMGYYGYQCENLCPHNCKQNLCDPVNGECLEGCNPGFYGRSCELPCPDKTYGTDCMSQCPVTCLEGSTCHHVNGSCTSGCDAGFWGTYCDNLCHTEKFGQNCENNCSDNCFFGACNPFTGYCKKCVTGREGLFCESLKKYRVIGPISLEAELSSDEIFLIFASMIGMGGLLWLILGASIYYRRKLDWQKMVDKGQLPEVASIIPPKLGRYPFMPKDRTEGKGFWRVRGSKRYRRPIHSMRQRLRKRPKQKTGLKNWAISIPQGLITDGYLSRKALEKERKTRLQMAKLIKEDSEEPMDFKGNKSFEPSQTMPLLKDERTETESQTDMWSKEANQGSLCDTLSPSQVVPVKETIRTPDTLTDTLISSLSDMTGTDKDLQRQAFTSSTEINPEKGSKPQPVTVAATPPGSSDWKGGTKTYSGESNVKSKQNDRKHLKSSTTTPVSLGDGLRKETSTATLHQQHRVHDAVPEILDRKASGTGVLQPGAKDRKEIKPKFLRTTSRVKSLQKRKVPSTSTSLMTDESGTTTSMEPSKSTTTESDDETSSWTASKEKGDEQDTSSSSTTKTASSTSSTTLESSSSSSNSTTSTIIDKSNPLPTTPQSMAILKERHIEPTLSVTSSKLSKSGSPVSGQPEKDVEKDTAPKQGFFQRGFQNLAKAMNRLVQPRVTTRPPPGPTIIVRDPPTPPPRPGSIQFFLNRMEPWRRAGGFQLDHDPGVFEVIEAKGSVGYPTTNKNKMQLEPKLETFLHIESSEKTSTGGTIATESTGRRTSQKSSGATETGTSFLSAKSSRTSSLATKTSTKGSPTTVTTGLSSFTTKSSRTSFLANEISRKGSPTTEKTGTSSYTTETTGMRSSSLITETGTKTSSLPTEISGTTTSYLPTEISGTKTSSLPTEISGTKTSSLPTEISGTKTSSLPTEISGTKTSSLPTEISGTKTSSLPTEISGTKTSSLPAEISGRKTSSVPSERSGTSSFSTKSSGTHSVSEPAETHSITTKFLETDSSINKTSSTSAPSADTSKTFSSSTMTSSSTKSFTRSRTDREIKKASSSLAPATITTHSETMTSGQRSISSKRRRFQRLLAEHQASSKGPYISQKISNETPELSHSKSDIEDYVRPQSAIKRSEIPSAVSVKKIHLWGPGSMTYEGQPNEGLSVAETTTVTEGSSSLSKYLPSGYSSSTYRSS